MIKPVHLSRPNQREQRGSLNTFTIRALRAFLTQRAPAELVLDEIIRRCAALNKMYIELSWLEELELLGEYFTAFIEYLRTEADWDPV